METEEEREERKKKEKEMNKKLGNWWDKPNWGKGATGQSWDPCENQQKSKGGKGFGARERIRHIFPSSTLLF